VKRGAGGRRCPGERTRSARRQLQAVLRGQPTAGHRCMGSGCARRVSLARMCAVRQAVHDQMLGRRSPAGSARGERRLRAAPPPREPAPHTAAGATVGRTPAVQAVGALATTACDAIGCSGSGTAAGGLRRGRARLVRARPVHQVVHDQALGHGVLGGGVVAAG